MTEDSVRLELAPEGAVDNTDVLLADGFEAAFLGLADRFGWSSPVAVYDRTACIRILVERDGMTHEQAVECFEFNTLGSWVGEQTPIFLTGVKLDTVHALASRSA